MGSVETRSTAWPLRHEVHDLKVMGWNPTWAKELLPLTKEIQVAIWGGGKWVQEKFGGWNEKSSRSAQKFNIFTFFFVFWNCQIWSNFNTYVIFGGQTGGGKKIFGGKCPYGPATGLFPLFVFSVPKMQSIWIISLFYCVRFSIIFWKNMFENNKYIFDFCFNCWL